MSVRIFQPSKSAMQSGRAGTHQWVVVFEQESPRGADPLMGWTSSRDTREQLRLSFPTKEEAIAYCEREGLQFSIEEPRERKVTPKAYADNFAFKRALPWTH
jgi:hypothetical protein